MSIRGTINISVHFAIHINTFHICSVFLLHLPLLPFSVRPFIHFLYWSLSCAIFFNLFDSILPSLPYIVPCLSESSPSYSPSSCPDLQRNYETKLPDIRSFEYSNVALYYAHFKCTKLSENIDE